MVIYIVVIDFMVHAQEESAQESADIAEKSLFVWDLYVFI